MPDRRTSTTRLATIVYHALGAHGLRTLDAAAAFTGVGKRTLIRVLHAEAVPHEGTLRRLADTLELDLDELLEARASRLRAKRRAA